LIRQEKVRLKEGPYDRKKIIAKLRIKNWMSRLQQRKELDRCKIIMAMLRNEVKPMPAGRNTIKV
jgi:hypothetical protein